jgi:molecular chaperone GrpE (heat shock protein)
MTSEPNSEDTSVKVQIIPQSGQISPQTSDLVETEMAGESDDVKSETKALIDALKKRAQAEAQNAGTLTRETYLNAVRKARETLEQNQLIERDRIEHSFELIKKEAEKNWESIVKEIAEVGDRLADAAKAAWDALTAPRPRS